VGHDRLSAVAGVCDPALGLDQRFGSKRTWIAAIALFAGGSALCALATSAGALIAFRVLQGLGGGMLVLAGFTLVAQSAGPQRVGRALALIGVPILLGPIFGPIIGGLIVDSAPWPWIFVVNVPIAVVAIVVAARVLHPDAGRADAGALDWVGAALLCPGLAGIAFGLSETESQGGIDHPIAFGPIVAGLALVGLFTWHSLRVAHPLIDLRLFRSRGFRAAAATTFLLGAALFGTLLVLPLYYQVDRGESALNAGLLLAPQGIGAALMLPISGRLTDRLGGPVVVAGCSISALAALPLALVSDHTPYAMLAGVLVVRGLGLGASVQPAAALPAGERAQISGSVATAFGHTFMWAAVMALVAIVPAVALLRAERANRRPSTFAGAETGDADAEFPRANAASQPPPRLTAATAAERKRKHRVLRGWIDGGAGAHGGGPRCRRTRPSRSACWRWWLPPAGG
jgi:EmrB/QacA subfamily drug resistance transporter